MTKHNSSIKFNKTQLLALIQDGDQITVKDTVVSGLKFKVGKMRSVFQFEKRISGKKGSPMTATIGAFPTITVEEARLEARRLANYCERGIDPRLLKKDINGLTPINDAPGAPTEHHLPFVEVLGKFFDIKKEIGWRTLRHYRQLAKHQFNPAWLDMDIRDITSDMVYEQFHEAGKTARATCWHMLKLLTNIWNTCAPFYRDQDNQRLFTPCPVPEVRDMLKNVTKDKPKRPVISETMLGQFLITVEQLRAGKLSMQAAKHRAACTGEIAMLDIVALSLFTAFRFNEARCLRWEYVDLEHGVIHLPGVTKKGSGQSHAFEGTKNHHDHWVPLSSYPLELLKKRHAERSSLSPYVFPSVKKQGEPIGRNKLVFSRISALIGRTFSPHATRRTFAGTADDAGLGFLTVKRMLNHAFQGGTTGGYVVPGFNPSKERANFQKVCDYILDRRSRHLGEAGKAASTLSEAEKLLKLERFALELGIDPVAALEAHKAGNSRDAA